MAVNIVTGMTGIEHITSHDDRARNASQFGRGKYVLDVGNKFSASIIDDNLVRIQDGMCINQGTQMGIEPNDYADVEIDNGLLGTNRHDIIVMRYEKNEETLLEKASLAVVKGVNSSEPVDPDITEGNILDGGDLVDDMPLYRVVIEGVNLVSIEPLFEVFDGDVGSILEKLDNKVDKVTGKGLSTNDYTNEDKAKVDGIPTKTSDLQNDSNFISDADYVHTDNNYTNAEKEDVAKIDTLDTNQTQILSDVEVVKDTLGYEKRNLMNPAYRENRGDNILHYIEDGISLKAGTYTVSYSVKPDVQYIQTLDEIIIASSNAESKSFTLSVNTVVAFNAYYGSQTIDLSTVNVQLERGATATDYTPYVDDVNIRLSTNETALLDTKTVTGNPISVSDSAHVNAEGLVVTLEPIQSGSGDPSPENIRPISGYDETSVVRSGKNLGQLSTSNIQSINGHKDDTETYVNNGVIVTSTSNYGRCGYQFSVKNGKTYTISMMAKKSASMGGGGILFGYTTNWDAEYGDFRDNAITTSLTKITKTFTAVDDILYVGVYPNTNGVSVTVEDFMIEEGEQATTYEPYTADTYTLQFGNTVYGAEVDFVSGVATVAKGYIAEYAGETLPSTWISDRDVYASGTTPTTGAEVVYELATPYAIQLTPQQIKMLKGNNVLVADGGMNLTYQVDSVVGDVKEWAENEFLPKASETAQHNYSTQEQVIGTWIDGSTLYEKTYICACDNTSNVQAVISFTDERVKIVSDAYFMNSLGHQIRIWWGGTLFWDYVITNDAVSVKRETSESDWQSDVTFVVTIQYTKTTD